MSNIEDVKYFLRYFNENASKDGFYEALLLYEVFAPTNEELSNKLVKKVNEIVDKYENVYSEGLRSDIRDLKSLINTKEKEMER